MNKTIGFIGSGNMGGAMIGGIISSGVASAEQIIASALREEKLLTLKERYGIKTTLDNTQVARVSDILFLSVKPNVYPVVIEEIRNDLKADTVVVAIAAGQSISAVESMFATPIKLVRAMPNTPALVGEAMSALTPNSRVSQEELANVTTLFNSFGKSQVVSESLMDAVVGVSGSSPAYVYLFIEAMADAAVADGMPRAQAYEFAAQTVLGSAKMVLETKLHPGALKDMVCSPGGTTIEGVAVLEQEGLRNAVIKAQRACTQKSKDMSK